MSGMSSAAGDNCQIYQESLDALNLSSLREALSSRNTKNSSNSCESVTSGSEASAPALTDCSSRSSLTDLDLSIDEDDYGYGFHEFKDLPATPTGEQQGYLTPLSSPFVNSSLRSQSPQSSYIPRILQQKSPQTRSVSFSGIEEVFDDSGGSCVVEEDEGTDDQRGALGIAAPPRTPVHQYYYPSTKHHSGSHQALPPLSSQRLAHPPLATKPRRNPHLLPRRSALKKQTNEGQPCLVHPVSPKILWYGSPRPQEKL